MLFYILRKVIHLEQQNRIFTKRFISLFLTNIAVFLVFYGLTTTLPLYAIGTLGVSEEESGLPVTAFLIAAIIVRPFSGKLLDLYGKKKLLMIALVFYLLCNILYLFVEPFSLLLALRFFQGIWFSIVTTAASSLAADIIPANKKGAGLGYFTMSNNLAIVIGPFISILVVQHYSFDTLFLVLTIIVAIGAVIAATIKTDDLIKPVLTNRRLTFSFHDLFEKKALPVAVLASIIGFSYASVLSFLSLYAENKGLLAAASYFYVVFAAAMLLTRPFTGKIYDTKGPKYVVIPAIFSFALGLVLLGLADDALLFLGSALFIGFGYGTVTTSFQTLAVQSALIERSAYATATYFTFFDLGIALGSYILGIIATAMGYENIFFVAALLLAIVFVLYMIQERAMQKRKTYQ